MVGSSSNPHMIKSHQKRQYGLNGYMISLSQIGVHQVSQLIDFLNTYFDVVVSPYDNKCLLEVYLIFFKCNKYLQLLHCICR